MVWLSLRLVYTRRSRTPDIPKGLEAQGVILITDREYLGEARLLANAGHEQDLVRLVAGRLIDAASRERTGLSDENASK